LRQKQVTKDGRTAASQHTLHNFCLDGAPGGLQVGDCETTISNWTITFRLLQTEGCTFPDELINEATHGI
jgi:hypothetical protein